MAITLTINGTTRQWQAGSLLIDEQLNGQPRLSLKVYAAAAAWRPALDQTLVLADGATNVFGGIIIQAREMGPGNTVVRRDTDIVTEIVAVSYSVLASYRYVTRTFTSGTLKSYLQALVDDYLDDDGVALHAGQVDGPTLPDLVYDTKQLNEVLNEFAQLTGYAWEITYDKKLRMFSPGSEAAPTSITAANRKAIGDVIVEPKRGPYFNRVIVKAGQNVQVDKEDDYTGDGSTDTFPITYPMVYTPTVGYGYVWNGDDPANPGQPNYETLDLAGNGATWEYDPPTNSITRVAGAPANLNAINITYKAQFPILVTAEDAGEIALHGVREKVIVAPDVYDINVAQDIADAELARGISTFREVTYKTAEGGLHPGQTQTITFSQRNLNATCMITTVRTRDVAGKLLHRDVTALEGSTLQKSDRIVYKDWLERGDAGSVAVTSGGFAPHPPQRAVQAFRDGKFYGSSELLYDFDSGGINHGVTNIPSVLAVTTDDNRHHIALVNTTNGAAKALTFRMIDGGDTLIEQDGGNDVSLDVYGGGNISMSAADMTFIVDDYATNYLRMRGLQQTVGLMPATTRVTSTYTWDSGISGGLPDFAVFANGTFTVTAPDVTSSTMVAGVVYRRCGWLVNCGTGIVTFAAHSGQTINGLSSIALRPGQFALWQSLSGTDAGIYALVGRASDGADIRTATVTLTDAQIKALPTTPITVIAAPPTGYRTRLHSVSYSSNCAAGAYTGFNATYVDISLLCGGNYLAYGPVNDSTTTPPLAMVTALLGTTTPVVLDINTPSLASFGASQGYVQNINVNSHSTVSAAAVTVAMDNNGSGNLGGGNAANSLKVTAYFTVESV